MHTPRFHLSQNEGRECDRQWIGTTALDRTVDEELDVVFKGLVDGRFASYCLPLNRLATPYGVLFCKK
jgi:hypothetical protein